MRKKASSLVSSFENGVAKALTTAQKKGLNKARELSSGGYTLAELAALDHPYARRHGMPLASHPVEVINAQTGDFKKAWEAKPVTKMKTKVKGSIENHDPKADYLTQPNGSPKTKMFKRPVDVAVEKFTQETLERELMARIKELENTDFYV